MLRRLLDTLFGRAKPPATASPPRDYDAESEARRVGQMSAEDRAWEAASLQRNRENEARAEAERDARR